MDSCQFKWGQLHGVVRSNGKWMDTTWLKYAIGVYARSFTGHGSCGLSSNKWSEKPYSFDVCKNLQCRLVDFDSEYQTQTDRVHIPWVRFHHCRFHPYLLYPIVLQSLRNSCSWFPVNISRWRNQTRPWGRWRKACSSHQSLSTSKASLVAQDKKKRWYLMRDGAVS